MTPLAFLFGSPFAAFTALAAAVAVPIIIHLINRRRFRVVTWAAMRFLLAAQRRNTRKMRLEQMILDGEFEPGQRINEAALAERFRTSRGPVREALRALEECGLVRAERNRGVFVREVSLTEADGSVRALADRWNGKRFNSPNDLAIDGKGNVYFTDPRYGGKEPREIEFEGVYVVTPAGNFISGISLTENFANLVPGTAQMQIVQESITQLRIRLVADDTFGDSSRAKIAELVRDTFGTGVAHEVELVDAIPQEPSGKYRFCISKVARERMEAMGA